MFLVSHFLLIYIYKVIHDICEYGNTLNLHFNSTFAQEVWSFNQFTRMCSRENMKVAYTHIHTISILLKIMYLSLLIYNYLSNWASLLGHSNWALVCGLEWDQNGQIRH